MKSTQKYYTFNLQFTLGLYMFHITKKSVMLMLKILTFEMSVLI